MVKSWIESLKEYNKDNKEHWCIPKKGSKAYEKLERIRNKDNYENKAAEKIQSVVRNYQKKKKERIERYKSLIPLSTISDMMKPNENYINEKYIMNQIKEENKNRAIKKQKAMIPLYNLRAF